MSWVYPENGEAVAMHDALAEGEREAAARTGIIVSNDVRTPSPRPAGKPGQGAKTMKTTYNPRPALLSWLALILALLLGGACVPQDMVVSPLGMVVVGAGEDIQIRSLEVLTGIGVRGIPRQRAVAMALADYGPIKGHNVTMGAGLDSLCTAEGGAAAADTVIGDGRVVGVIGTSCSVAAVVAAPILSEAGLVMISASNMAPSLTSDLRGNAGVHSHAGYYRTASNDLYQAQAVAEFVYSELRSAQDGDDRRRRSVHVGLHGRFRGRI